MKINHIHVTAGRGFNHPFEQFANFRFDLNFQAELEEGDDAQACLLQLQAEAESAAEAHKERILADLKRKRQIESVLQRLESERRSKFDGEASAQRIADYEEQLTKLTSTPLILGEKKIHPGHEDHHPETDNDVGF